MSVPPEKDRHTAQHVTPGGAWTLRLGTVAGIPIRIHFTFLLLLPWIAFVSNGNMTLITIIYVLGLFSCVLLHELGHSIVAQKFGLKVNEIVLYPIGGVARMEELPAKMQELIVALAGPAVNVVIAAVILTVLTAIGKLAPWSATLYTTNGFWWQKVAGANIVLALFNLIPAFPMDGGRVLRAILAMRIGQVHATDIAASVGQFLAIVFGFVGIFESPMLIIIAFFIYLGAGQEAAMYRGKALVEGVKVAEAMITDFRVLPVGATLQQAAELLLQTSQQDFPIMMDRQVIGVLSRQNLLRGISNIGGDGYVAGVMDREYLTASPEDSLNDLATKMSGTQSTCAMVMDRGSLVGIVTMENMAELLVLRKLMQKNNPNPHNV